MILFDVRWAINDIEVKAFELTIQTRWPPKVLLSQGKKYTQLHKLDTNLMDVWSQYGKVTNRHGIQQFI